MCEERLWKSIDAHIVVSTLALAERHDRVQLKKACIGFMSSQGVLAQIRETEDFKHLILSCLPFSRKLWTGLLLLTVELLKSLDVREPLEIDTMILHNFILST
jgi:hypothetical protein